MKIWIVTRANEHGEGPTLPVPYATESAAEAHMEAAMAEEWQNYGPEDDATGERLPCPEDWRTAQETILENFSDGSWTPYEITVHDVNFRKIVEAAAELPDLVTDLVRYTEQRAHALQTMAEEARGEGDEQEAHEYEQDAETACDRANRARYLVAGWEPVSLKDFLPALQRAQRIVYVAKNNGIEVAEDDVEAIKDAISMAEGRA